MPNAILGPLSEAIPIPASVRNLASVALQVGRQAYGCAKAACDTNRTETKAIAMLSV